LAATTGLRRVDVEAGAQAEVVGGVGVVRHALAPRTGVRGHEDQAELGAGPLELPLLGDIGVVQVRPERYQTTGRGPGCGGRNTEKVIAVPVSRLWWR
jgi:hypothetical protein